MVSSMGVTDTHIEKDTVGSLYSYRDLWWMCRVLKLHPMQDSSGRVQTRLDGNI